jgi:hypothetical protein
MTIPSVSSNSAFSAARILSPSQLPLLTIPQLSHFDMLAMKHHQQQQQQQFKHAQLFQQSLAYPMNLGNMSLV